MRSIVHLALPLAAAGAVSLPAQGPQYSIDDFMVDSRKLHVDPSSGGVATDDGTAGDVDGDGDVDLVVGDLRSVLLLNDGFGRFTRDSSGRIPAFGETTEIRRLTDLDGDGDLDLLLFSLLGGGEILRNDGSGRFTRGPAMALPVAPARVRDAKLADFDGDQIDDVLIHYGTGASGFVHLWLNDGTGTFQLQPGAFGPSTPYTGAFAIGDVDRDGDQDVVFAKAFDPLRVLTNDGAANFTETVIDPGATQPVAATLADFDADGDLDYAQIGVGGLEIYSNYRSSGTFSPAPTTIAWTPPIFTFLIAFGQAQLRFEDLDGSGVPKFLALVSSGPITVFERHGMTYVEKSGEVPIDSKWLGLADFDGDQDLDIALPYGDTVDYWVNDGDSNFVGGARPRPGVTAAHAFGDVNGDLAPDYVTGSFRGGVVSLHLNDRLGGSVQQPLGTFPDFRDAEIVDTDRDGNADILIVQGQFGRLYQPRLLTGDGLGNFVDATASKLPALTTFGEQVAYAEFNGDAYGDILVVGDPSLLLLGQSDGTFLLGTAPANLITDSRIGIADIDNDFDLDLVDGTFVWRNDGTGIFTRESGQFVGTAASVFDVALMDFDGDGNIDLLRGDALGGSVWTNDGTGLFTQQVGALIPVGSVARRVAGGDVDGDGDLDAVLAIEDFNDRFIDQTVWIHLNNGSGVFFPVGAHGGPSFQLTELSLVDIDNDMDLDMPGLGKSGIRHLVSRYVLRAGGPARFEIRMFGGGAGRLLLADRLAPNPILTPLGLLSLEPSSLALGPINAAGADDTARIEFVMPNLPVLYGLELMFQAIVIGPYARGLTNTIAETIVR